VAKFFLATYTGSAYFMVQLPDGTMERRMKMPLNVDPGVHSGFNLDQIVPGSPLTPVPTVVTLPTIAESKATDGTGSKTESDSSHDGSMTELKNIEDKVSQNPEGGTANKDGITNKIDESVVIPERNNNPALTIVQQTVIEEESDGCTELPKSVGQNFEDSQLASIV